MMKQYLTVLKNFAPHRLRCHAEHIIAGMIVLSALCLGFVGLGNNRYWDDEAETAIFARNFLANGNFTGWDGRNLVTYRNGALLDKNLCSVNSPLSYIVAAAGFKLWGVSTAAGRAPFVLFGIASLVMFWLLLREEFPQQRALRLYAMALTGLSYSFLLNVRQCRYYALCLFFGVATCYFYKRAVREGCLRWYIFSALALALLFYSNFLLCAAMAGGILCVHVIFHARACTAKHYAKAAAGMLLFAALIVPYAVRHPVWERHDVENTAVSLPVRTLILFYQNMRELDWTGYLPLCLVIIVLTALFFIRKKERFPGTAVEWTALVAGYVLTLSALSIQPAVWRGWNGGLADIRYLVTLLPFCAGIVAALLYQFNGLRWGRHIAVLLLCLALSSTVLTLHATLTDSRWLLPSLVKEIFNDYDTSYDAAVGYLAANAGKDEIVYAYPEYTMRVLQFYLGDRLRMQGLLRSPSLPGSALGRVRGLKYIDETYPDRLVLFGLDRNSPRILRFFSRGPYAYKLDAAAQHYVLLPVFAHDMTRPELPLHHFGPVTGFDPRARGIYIFKRMKRG